MTDPSNPALRRAPFLLGVFILLAVIGLAPFDMARFAQSVPAVVSSVRVTCVVPATASLQPGRGACPPAAGAQPTEASAAFLIALMFRP